MLTLSASSSQSGFRGGRDRAEHQTTEEDEAFDDETALRLGHGGNCSCHRGHDDVPEGPLASCWRSPGGPVAIGPIPPAVVAAHLRFAPMTRTCMPEENAPSTDLTPVIIGAGPPDYGGLSTAQAGVPSTILEADDVGGISRTAEREGWRFDIGGHRFFTKVKPVEELWHEILPDEDFLLRPRKSRIYYDGTFYDYPLKAMNALRNLGIKESVLSVGSYAMARVRPPKDQENYEGWLVARFGWRLYNTFFKTYTEKVWGMKVADMPADWAAQRVKNLSLLNAITNAILPKRNQKDITSLIEEFQYPKYGPGMMWRSAAISPRRRADRRDEDQGHQAPPRGRQGHPSSPPRPTHH
jgi:hypothetical protein